jgi:two-component system chemotaxis sensor kinase CheA
MDRELHELRDTAEQLRLMPVETLLVALERTARDSARSLSRQVAFESTGADLRLDAHVLAAVQGALVQLVRNAVVHGIESVEARRAAGKPDAGRIAVEASRRGRRIVFTCRDDGGGLDFEAVRRAARQRGLLGAETTPSRPEDLVRLLLHGGISTATTVTELSGRGIGLDVVRETVAQLGGEVDVHTEPGRGTTFRLVVPPSLASTEVLKVAAGDAIVCMPLDAVRRTLHVAAADIAWAASGASVQYDSQAIPFVPLQTVLDGTPAAAGRGWTVVVVAGAERLAAIGVDRMLGISRSVVRPLPALTPANAVVAGAVLDAEGNPQLALDPDALVADACRGDRPAVAVATRRYPVLVVDDSLTTRMLEQSILESAGYDVDVALSAEEGLETARRRRYALFLVDVEMPGMDGFTFVERVRADPALHDVPAILVTSRNAPEDLQRGRDAGAQGYVVKSDFDQNKLLAMIRPLVA